MTPIPTPEDVARVALIGDLAARNLEVTRGYHAFSRRLSERMHFIADVFRARQQYARLFESPVAL